VVSAARHEVSGKFLPGGEIRRPSGAATHPCLRGRSAKLADGRGGGVHKGLREPNEREPGSSMVFTAAPCLLLAARFAPTCWRGPGRLATWAPVRGSQKKRRLTLNKDHTKARQYLRPIALIVLIPSRGCLSWVA
jgi:hypothetical protein